MHQAAALLDADVGIAQVVSMVEPTEQVDINAALIDRIDVLAEGGNVRRYSQGQQATSNHGWRTGLRYSIDVWSLQFAGQTSSGLT